MANKSMPDSNYDTDKNRAYDVIWKRTIKFHAKLRGEAEDLARNAPQMEIKHVDTAYKQVIKSESKSSIISKIFGELFVVIGGILISPVLSEILSATQNQTSITPLSILAAIIGILLISFKIILD